MKIHKEEHVERRQLEICVKWECVRYTKKEKKRDERIIMTGAFPPSIHST